jgi:hypothetical protein
MVRRPRMFQHPAFGVHGTPDLPRIRRTCISVNTITWSRHSRRTSLRIRILPRRSGSELAGGRKLFSLFSPIGERYKVCSPYLSLSRGLRQNEPVLSSGHFLENREIFPRNRLPQRGREDAHQNGDESLWGLSRGRTSCGRRYRSKSILRNAPEATSRLPKLPDASGLARLDVGLPDYLGPLLFSSTMNWPKSVRQESALRRDPGDGQTVPSGALVGLARRRSLAGESRPSWSKYGTSSVYRHQTRSDAPPWLNSTHRPSPKCFGKMPSARSCGGAPYPARVYARAAANLADGAATLTGAN